MYAMKLGCQASSYNMASEVKKEEEDDAVSISTAFKSARQSCQKLEKLDTAL